MPNLDSADVAWLERFFSTPNELDWGALTAGSAAAEINDRVRIWLTLLADNSSDAPIILPLVRGGDIVCWYATSRGVGDRYELESDIKAWLGPSYLSECAFVSAEIDDALASAMRSRGGAVFRFSGTNRTSNQSISDRLLDIAALLKSKPNFRRRMNRPVGSIRADFERALLAQDAEEAEARIAELRETGRLNEENLRYMKVRLEAGLGYWPQVARDSSLIRNLSDLALPPQTLADLIEALYRTYIDDIEADEPNNVREAFAEHIAKRYPKLFASRRGIRSSRVVKSFLLFEHLQAQPNSQIISDLLAILPESDRLPLFSEVTQPARPNLSEAESAFDDGQYDRAFEMYLSLPLDRKSIVRLVTCANMGGTDAQARLSAKLANVEESVVAQLPPKIRDKLEELKLATDVSSRAPARPTNEWMAWLEQLTRGEDLASAEQAVKQAATNWDAGTILSDKANSSRFATLLGNVSGDAAAVARRSIPSMISSFLPQGGELSPFAKEIGLVLFALIAMDDVLSRVDLELLAQLLPQLLSLGLSDKEYLSLISDIEDVQSRVGSYANLTWSFDVCETLAIAPSPTETCRDARLRLFLKVTAQTQTFAHRLQEHDRLLLQFLAKDYGIDTNTIAWARQDLGSDEKAQASNLDGKTVGIYTLAETAGLRAKATLEKLFPGAEVVINSDTVCTPKLKSLAKAADMFIFAWKSASHQAFYCVKDALVQGEPIWAQGKGTASIIRAVLDNVG